MPHYQTYQGYSPVDDRPDRTALLLDRHDAIKLQKRIDRKYVNYKAEIELEYSNGNGFRTTMRANIGKLAADAVKVLGKSDAQLITASKPHYARYKGG